jgi:nickel-dependent lactate racemase
MPTVPEQPAHTMGNEGVAPARVGQHPATCAGVPSKSDSAEVAFRCGDRQLRLALPPGTEVFAPDYPAVQGSAAGQIAAAMHTPLGSRPLVGILRRRRPGRVVVVVSDATRPIPYADFLPELLAGVEANGVATAEILVLIATGMHRPSTAAERLAMFGAKVVQRYCIEDHHAEDAAGLAQVPGASASGRPVWLNRHYVEAGFRLVTGLVEPHFMAGFSGGRKAICPGLASLETVGAFHGAVLLGDERATNARLAGNPLHAEALSVARLCPPDFSVNVVLDQHRRVARVFAGASEPTHEAACEFVQRCACRPVTQAADVVVTSSGGYPLDATFYQCVKGFVSCLPAVRAGGVILAFGGCREGIGSPEYATTMRRYAGRWQEFLRDIVQPGVFTKDQWQFQMHARALARVGQANLHFVTEGLSCGVLAGLSVNGHAAAEGQTEAVLQHLLERAAGTGARVAAFPEGPYCVPRAAGD